MIDITFIRSYTQRLQDAIATINKHHVIIDNSQMAIRLDKVSKQDNHLLFAVIPSFSPEGRNVDDFAFKTDMVYLVLQKTAYADLNESQFLDIMQETLLSAQAVINKMLADKADFTEEGCLYMKQLNVQSIQLNPVWGMADCNGWSIEFNFETIY